MPWCPKCKSEYRDGFSICADCGSELVDEETFARLEAERFAAGRIVPVQKAGDAPDVFSGFHMRRMILVCHQCIQRLECGNQRNVTITGRKLILNYPNFHRVYRRFLW